RYDSFADHRAVAEISARRPHTMAFRNRRPVHFVVVSTRYRASPRRRARGDGYARTRLVFGTCPKHFRRTKRNRLLGRRGGNGASVLYRDVVEPRAVGGTRHP